MRMISLWTVTVEYTTTPRGVPEVVGEGPATATPVAEAHKFLIPRPAREHFLKSFGTSVFQTHHVDELLRHLEIAEVHRLLARWRESDLFACSTIAQCFSGALRQRAKPVKALF